jgi:multicomponent Na+:H+ antiporter subunit D
VISLHLPVLQVILPLLGAPFCLLLRKPQWAWTLALLFNLVTFFIAIALLRQTLSDGIISYALGDWVAPWGIEYRVDALNAFVILIVSGISFLVLLFAYKSVPEEIPEQNQSLFYTAYLLCLTGSLGVCITGDAFNLFVFLEIFSLSSIILISMGKERHALTAAFHYLIMGTIGATFILIGIGLIYMVTGTLNMHDLAQRLPSVSATRTILVAFAFLSVGISLKLALFPLHLWLPNAYTFAPSVVSAFLAATATKVAAYVLMRFVFTIFGYSFVFLDMSLGGIFLTLAIMAIFFGSVTAIFQDNIKRMLAYSSVAQIGYIVLGISFSTVTGLTASILHLFNHALMKGGLFLALGCIFYRIGSVRIVDFNGLGKLMPWTMAAIVTGGLSLVGSPLTVGFISKWYLILAALENERLSVAVLILAGSLLTLAYIWKLVEAAYFHEPGTGTSTMREAPASLLIPTWALITANIYFGINTDLTIGVATRAAEILLGVQP